MIPDDCIPEDNAMIMEVFGLPDRMGRCIFNLYWNVDYIPGHPNPSPHMVRGQCFFAEPSEYREKHKITRLIDRMHSRTIIINQ